MGHDVVGEPERHGGDGGRPSAVSVRENFGQHHPDDRTERHGERCDVGQDEEQDERPRRMTGVEGSPDRRKTDGHDRRTDKQQRFAADLVDEPDGENRKCEIDEADENRLHERSVRARAGRFKDFRRVIHDGVDAGDLLQHGEADADEQREP